MDFRDAINDRYYDQSKENVYGYKLILSWEYVVEVRQWWFLVNLEIGPTRKQWSRGLQLGSIKNRRSYNNMCDSTDSVELHMCMLER